MPSASQRHNLTLCPCWEIHICPVPVVLFVHVDVLAPTGDFWRLFHENTQLIIFRNRDVSVGVKYLLV